MNASDGPRPAPERRSAELASRLDLVQGRIEAACQAAGRSAREVTLVAITKTFPASDVRLLAALGVRDVGENRDSEAARKAAQCADLGPPLTWHFVGQLQTNKCASVVSYAAVVQSVDRLRLVRALGPPGRPRSLLPGAGQPRRGPRARRGDGRGGSADRGRRRSGAGPRAGRRDGRRAAGEAAKRRVREARRDRRHYPRGTPRSGHDLGGNER